jgi:hypothetical protein
MTLPVELLDALKAPTARPFIQALPAFADELPTRPWIQAVLQYAEETVPASLQERRAWASRTYAQVKALVRAGAPLNSGAPTPLMEAAALALPAIVHLLLDAGADPHQRTPLGSTALHAAVGASVPSLGIIRTLLATGPDLRWADEQGRTVLHAAARRPHRQVLGLLYRTTADWYQPDRSGRTPLQELEIRSPTMAAYWRLRPLRDSAHGQRTAILAQAAVAAPEHRRVGPRPRG